MNGNTFSLSQSVTLSVLKWSKQSSVPNATCSSHRSRSVVLTSLRRLCSLIQSTQWPMDIHGCFHFVFWSASRTTSADKTFYFFDSLNSCSKQFKLDISNDRNREQPPSLKKNSELAKLACSSPMHMLPDAVCC